MLAYSENEELSCGFKKSRVITNNILICGHSVKSVKDFQVQTQSEATGRWLLRSLRIHPSQFESFDLCRKQKRASYSPFGLQGHFMCSW